MSTFVDSFKSYSTVLLSFSMYSPPFSPPVGSDTSPMFWYFHPHRSPRGYKWAGSSIFVCGGWQPLDEHRLAYKPRLWFSLGLCSSLVVQHEDCSRRVLSWGAGQDLRDNRLSGEEGRGKSGPAALLWRLPSSAKWRRHEVHGNTSQVQNDADFLQVSSLLLLCHVSRSATAFKTLM